jgi:hypothetical protein
MCYAHHHIDGYYDFPLHRIWITIYLWGSKSGLSFDCIECHELNSNRYKMTTDEIDSFDVDRFHIFFQSNLNIAGLISSTMLKEYFYEQWKRDNEPLMDCSRWMEIDF